MRRVLRLHLTLSGRVQGVGFRPALYRLCRELGLLGTIANSDRGVVADLEGAAAELEALRSRLSGALPTHARVERREEAWLTPRGVETLEILHSQDTGGSGARVPADLATCPACRAEIADPADRRRGYALTNCTDCGPRFTITRAVPYDRGTTTMASFPLCAACAGEYRDIDDRRYHAEPMACPACGPSVSLLDRAGEPVGGGEPLAEARALLRAGGVLAVKGLGGYHLAVDATNDEAVARLRRDKRRPHRPLAIMVRDLEQAQALVVFSGEEARLLTSPAAPIVLLPRQAGAGVSRLVAPGMPRLGVMLAYTPLHLLLLGDQMPPLVMTSGNRAGEPIITDDAEAQRRLEPVADAFLVHGREILVACEDSVVSGGPDAPPMVVRRSRGHVPDPIPLPADAGVALATGGQLKVCCCLVGGGEAYLGPHVGDLGSVEGEAAYQRALDQMTRLLRLQPEAVVHDMHPDYLTTRLAQGMGLPAMTVQHHHAHAAAVAGEHGLEGPLLALCLDGTGYGDDGQIWGGELLLLPNPGQYQRMGSLRPFGLPGGERAIGQPWRAALGLVWATLGEDALAAAGALLHVGPRRLSAARAMLTSGVGVVNTTSGGRLFDAVAALCGLGRAPTYEAQPAVELEAAAHGAAAVTAYPVTVDQGEGRLLLDPAPMVGALLEDLQAGTPAATASARFHQGLAQGFCQLAAQAAVDRSGVKQVTLSGGCLVNQRLCAALIQGLQAAGLEPILPLVVPPNDGGLAYGQAVVWSWRVRPDPA